MLKRIFDLSLSVAALLALSPLLCLFALLIVVGDGRPVFYRGVRVGRHGRPFRIYKFRTMVVDAESQGASSTASDDPRVTRVGAFLRAHKLDELPQLLNVIAGHMSLVGPRPQVAWAVQLYQPHERALLDVRPGMTDVASIRFRNEAEILRGSDDPDQAYLEKIAPEKHRLGLKYIQRQSVVVDLRILLATAYAVLGGDPERLLGDLADPTVSLNTTRARTDEPLAGNR